MKDNYSSKKEANVSNSTSKSKGDFFLNLKSPSDPIPPGSSINTVLLFDITAGATGLQLQAKTDFKDHLFQLN